MRPDAPYHRLAAAALLACLAATAAPAAQTLALPGPATWKYLAVDPTTHTLFVAQGTQLTAIDTRAMLIRGRVTGLGNAHGVAIVPGGDGFVADSKAEAVIIFDPATLQAIATIPAGADTNSVAYDAASRRVFVGNDDAGSITVIDPATHRATATVQLPGDEGVGAMIPDGAGHLFIAHPATADIIRLATNTAVPRIDATWKLQNCPRPEGIALDKPVHRLFVSCAGGVLLALDSGDGRQLGAVPIGPGNLALILNPAARRLYVPTADSKMSNFQISATGRLAALPPIPTGPGARTAALDPAKGRLYLVTAAPMVGPTATPRQANTSAHVKPGTATLLAIDPPG